MAQINDFKIKCEKCGQNPSDTFVSAYGKIMCGDCWDDYIMTEEGLLEYFISIANQECNIKEFDADFLGSVVCSWEKYKTKTTYNKSERRVLEQEAQAVGLI